MVDFIYRLEAISYGEESLRLANEVLRINSERIRRMAGDWVGRAGRGVIVMYQSPMPDSDMARVVVSQPNGEPCYEILGAALSEVLSRVGVPQSYEAGKGERELVERVLGESDLESKARLFSRERQIVERQKVA